MQDSTGVNYVTQFPAQANADAFNPSELGKLPFHTEEYTPSPIMPFNPVTKNHVNDFVFWVLIGVVLVWAWLRTTSAKRIAKLSESFFSHRFVDQWIRDEGFLRSDVNVWLLFTSFVIIGLSLWQLPWFIDLFGLTQESPFIRFLWMFFGVAAVFILKSLAVVITNVLLTRNDFSGVYLFNSFLFSQVLALILFPLTLLYAYSNILSATVFIALTTGMFILAFVVRLAKLLVLGVTQSNFSAVYIILYLCSLEILPLGLVYSWIGN